MLHQQNIQTSIETGNIHQGEILLHARSIYACRNYFTTFPTFPILITVH